jgi:rhamnose utilization protein RhaD (predicted bifunctional aldolase and dehydrogenase)/NAD(P)-dependent dehydrogenase (short-subunit alcohol dehydrogenase family)
MNSRWSDSEAASFIDRYAAQGVSRDLALRVYTTRLLGQDPRLVLHGGGNSSVKTVMRDLLGDEVAVLCVKGSGWDMGNIEPPGLPAVRLEPLRRLRALENLSDEDMVNAQRGALLDSAAPNPSVETLLHAFLPHKFIDHTHAISVLALADQPDGEALCREVYDGRMALVPYIMPGFALAKKAAEIYEREPRVEGLILLKHGIFTLGEDARAAYERMIEMAGLAEARLQRGRRNVFAVAAVPKDAARVAAVAPILRGLCAIENDRATGRAKRQILCFRSSPEILNYVNGADLARYSQQGVVTPDHTIRTKNWPLLAPPPEGGGLDAWRDAVAAAIDAYAERYRAYFTRHNARQTTSRVALDPRPRVVLAPGLGLFGLGASHKDAAIAADIAENTITVVTNAEAIGRFQPIDEADMFDVEYWSLEQAKLAKAAEKPLARQVAMVTGGGSGIGAATAKAMAAAGAEVAVLDRDVTAALGVVKAIGGSALAIQCDVTDAAAVITAFDSIAEAFGGVDIVVSNAGAAWQGRIGEVDEAMLRRSFELNFFAHQSVAQNAVRIMRAQGTGGCLLFNTSKQAVNPGRDFGPYGLPKAATLFLMKQYALDYGSEGIRANAVNADRIRSGLLTETMIAERAHARGVSETDYMSGNLLRREVTAEDVAQAFVFLAQARTTTAAVVTVDGGNIEASLR